VRVEKKKTYAPLQGTSPQFHIRHLSYTSWLQHRYPEIHSTYSITHRCGMTIPKKSTAINDMRFPIDG